MTGSSESTGPTHPGAGDGRGRARGPFGPLEMLDDVQRQAFEAAMRVAGELSALTGDLSGAAWFSDAFARGTQDNGGGETGEAKPRVDVGKLRGDVVRAAETFSELMRALLDVGFDAMDELARRPSPRPSSSSPPGGVAQLHCTVHNDRRESVRSVRPHVGELVSDHGALLKATVDIQPPRLELEPHERATLQIDVAIPSDADRGRYHGLLLVAGLPNAAYPITVEVSDEATEQ